MGTSQSACAACLDDQRNSYCTSTGHCAIAQGDPCVNGSWVNDCCGLASSCASCLSDGCQWCKDSYGNERCKGLIYHEPEIGCAYGDPISSCPITWWAILLIVVAAPLSASLLVVRPRVSKIAQA